MPNEVFTVAPVCDIVPCVDKMPLETVAITRLVPFGHNSTRTLPLHSGEQVGAEAPVRYQVVPNLQLTMTRCVMTERDNGG